MSQPDFRALFSTFLCVFVCALALSSCSKKPNLKKDLEKGAQHFEAYEYDEAIIYYSRVSHADDSNALAAKRLGLMWLAQGAPFKALSFLSQASTLNPEDSSLRVTIAEALLTIGHRSTARSELGTVLKADPINDRALVLLAEASDTPEIREEVQLFIDRYRSKKGSETAAYHLASAKIALWDGKLEAAESHSQAAIALDPALVNAYLTLAAVTAARDGFDLTLATFRKAAAVAPPYSVAHLRIPEHYVRNGKLEEAKEALKDLTARRPGYLRAWLLTAELAIKEKRFEDAEAALAPIFSRDSVNFQARFLQGMSLITAGRLDEGIGRFEDLNSKYPGSADLQFQLGLAYTKNGAIAEAKAILEQILKASPNDTRAAFVLAQLKMATGDLEGAVDSLRALLKRAPGMVAAQLFLADAYKRLGKPDSAKQIYLAQLEVAPKNPGPLVSLGDLLAQQGDLAEARLRYEQAFAVAPASPEVIERLQILDIRAREFPSAHERVRAQLAKTPDSATLHFLEGSAFFAEGNWELAEGSLRKAIDLDPEFSRAHDLLISCYVAGDKLEAARDEAQAAIAADPSDYRRYITTAQVHDQMGEPGKARETYESLLAKNASYVPALNNYAYLLARKFGEADRGLELASQARTREPRNPAVADTLGWIHYLRGDYKKALQLLQESAESYPLNVAIQYHLGMANYALGNVAPARLALRAVVDSSFVIPEKDDAILRLRILGDGSPDQPQLSLGELQEITNESEPDAYLRFRIAEAHQKAGDPKAARTAAESATQLNPQLVLAHLALARACRDLGDLKAAAKAATEARDLAPDSPDAAALLGSVMLRSGDLNRAYSLLQLSANDAPGNPTVLYELATTEYALGKLEEARKHLAEIAALTPPSSNRALALTFSALLEKDLDSAADLAPSASSLLEASDPQHPALLVAKASGLLASGDRDGAAAQLESALEKYPDLASAKRILARLYAEVPEKFERAHQLAIAAIQAFPDDATLARVTGALSYKQGQFDFARNLLERASKREALDATHLFYLGMSQLELKQKEAGKATLKDALKNGLTGDLADQAREAVLQATFEGDK